MARARRGRGEGGIGQQDGRWFAEVSLGFDGNGKRIRKRVYADTKQEAQVELRKLQELASKGSVPSAGTMTVGELLDTWLSAMKATWAGGTHATHEQYVRNHIRPALGGVRLTLLYALHVQNLMKTMGENGVS